MPKRPPFGSPYTHGLVRVGVATPEVRLGDPMANAEATVVLAQEAHDRCLSLVVFPELGLSGYSLQDLFHQQTILRGSLEALREIVTSSQAWRPAVVVSLPLRVGSGMAIVAAVVHAGRILGVVPKSYLPSYREYYEKRHFVSGRDISASEVSLLGQSVPFGELIFRVTNLENFAFGVEICEDLWTPVPPSTWLALAGATVLCNPSASNATVAKAEYRRTLGAAQSGRCVAAYLYAGSGNGESTTDLAWDGHAMIWENAVCLAESERFASTGQLLVADIDLERLSLDRLRMTSFNDSVVAHANRLTAVRSVDLEIEVPSGALALVRSVPRFPYVPSDAQQRNERCEEVFSIQVQALAQRMDSSGIDKLVIGVSGGLDSTHALLVAARTCDVMGLPRSNILAYTMPGLATTERTKRNALGLMDGLGVAGGEIDIGEAARHMLARIGHPAASGAAQFDTTYENAQAGERTSTLFRLANFHGGLVLGTGDLSELALGWCSFGVGDQMSHYNVNASVPKTLIRHLLRWVVDTSAFPDAARSVLESILMTEISPELVPQPGHGDQPGQRSEDVVGPFELQDFHLYHVTRYGFGPAKVAYLCWEAWQDAERGSWPGSVPPDDRREYDLSEIRGWLKVFLQRFFENSQFKRSAMPDGPKVGSGGSLSPRGDWRAPSDAIATVWLEELEREVPENPESALD